MGIVLDGLIKLQSVETRLRVIKSKLARCRRTVIFQENQLRGLQNGLEAKKEEIQLDYNNKKLNFHIEKSPFNIEKVKAVTSLPYQKEYKLFLIYKNKNKFIIHW